MDIYKTQLLDHYRSPRNRGLLTDPDFSVNTYNPLCGDSVTMQGSVREMMVERLAFQGAGCVISQATASLLTDYAVGKRCEDISSITKEQILTLIGMQLGPTRLKCALLPLDALKQGLEQYTCVKKGESNVGSYTVDCSNSEGFR